ncbi:MAG: ABC transporter substrate-binding protein [Burkholderiales bacterium]|nr:ABC transporter substrate-binding protein [Burkholderiales bacterium]
MDRRTFASYVLTQAAAAAGFGFAGLARAQAPVKLRIVETVHILFFTPAYVALRRGFFKEQGLDVEITPANGTDKATALLLAGSADVMLVGPEAAFYVAASNSPTKVKMIAGITKRDGAMVVARQPLRELKADDLRGKTIIGSVIGSTPAVFLQAFLRRKGLDPVKDVNVIPNIAPPAKRGAFLSGQGDFAVFYEPDASAVESAGKGYVVASVGQEIGAIDHTAFIATDPYIAANRATLQKLCNAVAKAQKWLHGASPAAIAETIAPEFKGLSQEVLLSASRRGQTLDMWKDTPVITPETVNAFAKILIAGGTLQPSAAAPYQSLVDPSFAQAALKTVN